MGFEKLLYGVVVRMWGSFLVTSRGLTAPSVPGACSMLRDDATGRSSGLMGALEGGVISPLPATPPGALGVTVKDLLGDGVLWVLEGACAPIVKDLLGERAL